MNAEHSEGVAEYEQDFDPFSKDNAPKLQLIVSMRIYDALMAILSELEVANGKSVPSEGQTDKRTATRLHEAHSMGKIIGSLPYINLSEEE